MRNFALLIFCVHQFNHLTKTMTFPHYLPKQLLGIPYCYSWTNMYMAVIKHQILPSHNNLIGLKK